MKESLEPSYTMGRQMVASMDIPGLETPFEPFDPLCRCPIDEGVEDHCTARLSHDAVIADGSGRFQCLFQVSGLQEIVGSIRVSGCK